MAWQERSDLRRYVRVVDLLAISPTHQNMINRLNRLHVGSKVMTLLKRKEKEASGEYPSRIFSS